MNFPHLAIVAVLPESVPGRADFASREIKSASDLLKAFEELEEPDAPKWRVVSIVHIEDLPLLMEPPA